MLSLHGALWPSKPQLLSPLRSRERTSSGGHSFSCNHEAPGRHEGAVTGIDPWAQAASPRACLPCSPPATSLCPPVWLWIGRWSKPAFLSGLGFRAGARGKDC